jgi:CitMHS family citrate-Mg2+:H+ or citrate-Ca2+:H+ symporter
VAFTRTPVITALVVTPVVAAVAGGLSTQAGSFAVDGLKTVAPVAALMMFAVLYFGLMIDVGLFAPLIERLIGGCPRRSRQALPGHGGFGHARRLGRRRRDHIPHFHHGAVAGTSADGHEPTGPAAIVGLAAGVMNLLPWGGPTARAMSVLS